MWSINEQRSNNIGTIFFLVMEFIHTGNLFSLVISHLDEISHGRQGIHK